IEPNDKVRLIINSEIEYPVVVNKYGIEVLYFGNVEYYFNEEDRNTVYEYQENDFQDNNNGKKIEEEFNNEQIQTEITSNEKVNELTHRNINNIQENNNKQKLNVKSSSTELQQDSNFSIFSKGYSWDNVKYFRVITDNLTVYDNRSGSLKPIGKLKKGQVYPRIKDYGNWHQIQFGNIYGYVKKADTVPADGKEIKNENKSYKNQARTFKALTDVIVYDNTSGSLVPFGVIDKGQVYPIATDYGNWWRVIYADRVGYVRKSEVETQFTKSDKYFRAEKNLPIYDNRTGTLIKVGEIEKGQVYPRVKDYGNWHQIQFGNIYGYVHKNGTSPATGNEIKNLNTNYKNQSRTFKTLQAVTVYDNTSGKLVPFGKIE